MENLTIDSLYPWAMEHKRCGQHKWSVRWPRVMMEWLAGSWPVSLWPTYKGHRCLVSTRVQVLHVCLFSVRPISSSTGMVSILTRFHPISPYSSRVFPWSLTTLSLPRQTVSALLFFSELISDLLSDSKVCTPHTCCRTQTMGITRVTLSPRLTEKWLLESHGLLAGHPGLLISHPSMRIPHWAFRRCSSLALVTSCCLPYPPTSLQLRMDLRD